MNSKRLTNADMLHFSIFISCGALPGLETLDLSHVSHGSSNNRSITTVGWNHLIKALEKGALASLTDLYIQNNSFTDNQISAWVRALSKQSTLPLLTDLSVNNNNMQKFEPVRTARNNLTIE